MSLNALNLASPRLKLPSLSKEKKSHKQSAHEKVMYSHLNKYMQSKEFDNLEHEFIFDVHRKFSDNNFVAIQKPKKNLLVSSISIKNSSIIKSNQGIKTPLTSRRIFPPNIQKIDSFKAMPTKLINKTSTKLVIDEKKPVITNNFLNLKQTPTFNSTSIDLSTQGKTYSNQLLTKEGKTAYLNTQAQTLNSLPNDSPRTIENEIEPEYTLFVNENIDYFKVNPTSIYAKMLEDLEKFNLNYKKEMAFKKKNHAARFIRKIKKISSMAIPKDKKKYGKMIDTANEIDIININQIKNIHHNEN